MAWRSSAFRVCSVCGCRISQYIITSRVQAVVRVPAIIRTWASSLRRVTVFSEAGSLESRMAWKIVGWVRAVSLVSLPAAMMAICLAVFLLLLAWSCLRIGEGKRDDTYPFLLDKFG